MGEIGPQLLDFLFVLFEYCFFDGHGVARRLLLLVPVTVFPGSDMAGNGSAAQLAHSSTGLVEQLGACLFLSRCQGFASLFAGCIAHF